MVKKLDIDRCSKGECKAPCYVIVSHGLYFDTSRCLIGDQIPNISKSAWFREMLPGSYIEITAKLAKAMAYSEAMPDEDKF